MIAALFVEERGVYANLADVEVWGITRDARNYAGPWPVVAHPPCERWGRYWGGGPSAKVKRKLGDDGGCFAAAFEAVTCWGGVIEHPEGSHAWRHFGLRRPDKFGGWVIANPRGGWTCCVEQGHYGHRARKASWLYALGIKPPALIWGAADGKILLDRKSIQQDGKTVKVRADERMSSEENAATPIAFRDLLLGMARSVELRAAA